MPIDFETGGKPIVILNKEDAESLGLHSSDRVRLKHNGNQIIAIVDITTKFATSGHAVINNEVVLKLKTKVGEKIDVEPAGAPESVMFVREKIRGGRLTHEKSRAIIEDVVEKHLSDIELSAFVTALNVYGMSMHEIEGITRAMIATGKTIKLPGKIVDKHGVGGCAGDTTSMVLVPTIAASGLTIPKTSSRAITSPAGTADKMEVLAPVELQLVDIKRVIRKTNACLVWGGTLELAPADDAFIKIEYPLGIDPLLLPSIMSKKKAMGSKYLVIDIPIGRGAKVKTVGSAVILANDFIELGKRLKIDVACGVTYGEQPLGQGIGPALEAREALLTLQGKGPPDVVEKVTYLGGILFEMVGKNNVDGKKYAMRLLKSGKAHKKMLQIIEAQGGNPKVRLSDLPIGKNSVDVLADKTGKVLWVKNGEVATIAREAGAPKDKGAGMFLYKKVGDSVKKGDKLFTIYSDNVHKLNSALKLAKQYEPTVVAKRLEDKMLLEKVPEKIHHKKLFMLER